MKDFMTPQYVKVKQELDLIADMGVLPVRRLALTLTALGEALNKVKAYLITHPFKDDLEEIDFFKSVKPLLLVSSFMPSRSLP